MIFRFILAILIRIIAPDADALALQKLAPEPIDLELARENVAGARIAAIAVFPGGEVSPEYLLAIARRESLFQRGAVTAEVGGRVSCGVMTPIPRARCDRDESVIAGYLVGATHLREWLAATAGDLDDAQRGYAGGFRLLRACARGPVMTDRNGVMIDVCQSSTWIRTWAARIRRSWLVPLAS